MTGPRDVIDLSFNYENTPFNIIFLETAATRKKAKVSEHVECFSIIRLTQNIKDSIYIDKIKSEV